MSAPLIGMSFPSFVVLLILSAIAAAIVHWGFRYRLFQGIDGFLGQWVVAWMAHGLAPPSWATGLTAPCSAISMSFPPS